VADAPIRIKRYPNRRFYASHTSKYVSLTDIEQIIRDGLTVEIVDSQTGDDLTRAVLVQIIAERHPDKIAMFPPAMLHSILRANDVMADFLHDYFRNSLAYLDYFQKHGASGPLPQPMHWMKAWLDNWSAEPPGNPRPRSSAGQTTAEDEHTLHERIARLERQIAELEEERMANAENTGGRSSDPR
jgi:polyhydroxyalkanoate synthesis repressor PhaR